MMIVYDELSDRELTELLRDGDPQAFTCIYDRYWNIIFQACYNRLRDHNLSKDIIQNIFTALWDRRVEVRIDNLAAYLHTAVRFQVLRTAGRATRTEFVPTFEKLITEPVDNNDPVEEREVMQLLQLFIAALPEKRRIIFLKRYQENYTTAEIAEELGISKKTVLNQLNTAENNLRLRLAHLMTLSVLAAFWLRK